MRRPVWWESQLERDYIYLLEFDPDVESYREQPFRIQYTAESIGHHHVPDFLVIRQTKKQVVDVKPEDQARAEGNSLLFRIMDEICHDHGYEFCVVTEYTIRVQPRLSNVKLLYRYARTPIGFDAQTEIIDFIRRRGGAKILEIRQFLGRKQVSVAVLFSLLFRGALKLELNRPIDNEAFVWA